MAAETDALSSCKACIDEKQSFLLQGGAGSGKTESLKELLLYIKNTKPDASVVCITHTNAAVAEIVSRVGEDYVVSTIHSFLYNLIKFYRKNIWQVIPTLFQLEHVPTDCEEHKVYKDLYGQYKRKRYDRFKEESPDVIPKRTYDKDPATNNRALNQQIAELNQRIAQMLDTMEQPDRFYNETQFDSFRDASFGHDGLLTVFHEIFHRFPLFRKILRDKYDYIFIDEYQDTNADILRDMLDLSEAGGLAVCLFGDHMQSIYDGGIDTLDTYIDQGRLVGIPKEDNYRCSYEVIELINSLRTDGITQKVALKKVDGRVETEADRHGSARIWYTIATSKPNIRSADVEKRQHHELLERLIDKAKAAMGNPAECKVLILTNKEIAAQNGFSQLYKIFSDRYSDARERIENYLDKIQAREVAQLCRLYEQKRYNELICCVRKNGYEIRTAQDKTDLRNIMEDLTTNSNRSMWQAVELAISRRLIKQTEACSNEVARKDERETDQRYEAFCEYYEQGHTTYAKLKKVWDISSEEEFRLLDSKRKKEQFYRSLFSDALKFAEIRNYDAYLDEATEYITMHKTKGTSIQSVIVVMDEFLWNAYDFSLLYNPVEGKTERQEKAEKLIYVACSRARKDLVCIRVLTADEEDVFKIKFPQAEKIEMAELVPITEDGAVCEQSELR